MPKMGMATCTPLHVACSTDGGYVCYDSGYEYYEENSPYSRSEDCKPYDLSTSVVDLLKAGADPNLCNNGGDAPLHTAVKCGQLEQV